MTLSVGEQNSELYSSSSQAKTPSKASQLLFVISFISGACCAL